MRAPLSAAVRRRILGDLGIEVWRVRRTEVGEGASAPATAPVSAPEQVVDGRSAAAALTRGAASAGAASTVAAPLAPAPRLEGVALALPGAVLFLAGRPVGRDARFARDLLAAAAGAYALEPELRRFEWPPSMPLPGAQSPDAGQRALAAFLDKLLQDSGAKALLIETPMADLLPTSLAGVLIVRFPELSGLARDGAAKRAVWASLQPLHGAVYSAMSAGPAGPVGSDA
jgi:DNA polymerase III psi subunit